MINVLLQLAQTTEIGTEICQIHVTMDAMMEVATDVIQELAAADVIQEADNEHTRILRDVVLLVFTNASLC